VVWPFVVMAKESIAVHKRIKNRIPDKRDLSLNKCKD